MLDATFVIAKTFNLVRHRALAVGIDNGAAGGDRQADPGLVGQSLNGLKWNIRRLIDSQTFGIAGDGNFGLYSAPSRLVRLRSQC